MWWVIAEETISSAALRHSYLYLNKDHGTWGLIAEEYLKLSLSRIPSIFSGEKVITWHDASWWRNLFLEKYLISAGFLFLGSIKKLFYAIYHLYFCDMLRHDRNMTTHLTSEMLRPKDNTSRWQRLCSHMSTLPRIQTSSVRSWA